MEMEEEEEREKREFIYENIFIFVYPLPKCALLCRPSTRTQLCLVF